MGNFFTSIAIRSQKSEDLIRLLARLKRTAYVSPVVGEFIYVYDAKSAQDDGGLGKLLAKITKELDCPALGVINHDDDILAYVLHDRGRLLDNYDSMPGYFEGEDREPRGGQARVLAAAFGVEGKTEAIEIILRKKQGERDGYVFAVDRHHELCEALGLATEYAAMGYEYIDGRDGPFEDWSIFTEVGSGPAAAFRRKQASSDAQKKSLIAEGLLLNEIAYEQRKPVNFGCMPIWSIDPASSELMLVWSEFTSMEPVEPCKYAYPFRDPQPYGMKISPVAYCMTHDDSGRYLGVGYAGGKNTAEVWDLSTKTQLLQVQHTKEVRGLAFSGDGRRFFSLSDELTVSSLFDGVSPASRTLSPYTLCLALHPRLPYAVIGGADKLRVVETNDLQIVRECSTAPPSFDPEQVMEQVMRSMEGRLSLEQMVEQLQRLRATPLGQERIFQLRFSGDGQWLAAATSNGAKVYRWEDVLHGKGDVISPIFHCSSRELASKTTIGMFLGGEHIAYDVVFDDIQEILLFANLNGTIGWLHLQTGKYGLLLEIPGKAAALCMDLSSDRRAVIVTTKFMSFEAQGLSPTVQIWNYERLLPRVFLSQ